MEHSQTACALAGRYALRMDLSDEHLVSKARAILTKGDRLTARLIVHLILIEERRVHLRSAHESMFTFCTEELGMSESSAFRRTTAARLVRRFPMLLDHIERGTLHLSALVLLGKYLTEENVNDVIAEVAGKSKRATQAIIARRWPRPDVLNRLRKVRDEGFLPLAEDRHRLTITINDDLRAKVERALDLMRHRNPAGDLAVMFETAIDELLAKLERELLKKTNRVEKAAIRTAKVGHITAAARREVYERDGEQCTFTSKRGRRCKARAWLQLDHIRERGRGGSGEAANVQLLCYAHNRLRAEDAYGREHIEQQIDLRRSKPAPTEPVDPTVAESVAETKPTDS